MIGCYYLNIHGQMGGAISETVASPSAGSLAELTLGDLWIECFINVPPRRRPSIG